MCLREELWFVHPFVAFLIASLCRADLLSFATKVNPDTTAVRHLHVLSGQLLMLKRTLTPLQGSLLSLRHDDEKRTSVARRTASGNATPEGADTSRYPHPGFISPEAKLYLADVNGQSNLPSDETQASATADFEFFVFADHIDSVLSSLELFSKIADSIVDFIFNSLSFASNESMKW